jgi:hypothetical protein
MIKKNPKYPNNFSIIIGAMKSGTTSLFEVLAQHPEICGAKKKELDYFVKDNDSDNSEYYSFWDWNRERHTIALEASVAYAKSPYIAGVPARMIDSNVGEIRLIYLLRDPIKRIESQVRHGVFAGWGKSLDEGLPVDAINFSKYSMQIEQYLEYFPRDHILLVTLEEFKSEPRKVLTRICQFLKLNEDFFFRDVKETRNSGEFFNTSESVAKLTQSGFGQYLAIKVLPPKLKYMIRKLITRFGSKDVDTSNHGRWKLTESERGLVLAELEEDLFRLKHNYEVDVEKFWQIKVDPQGQD